MQTTILEQIQSNPIFYWLLIAFAGVTVVQLVYFWGLFSRLAFYKPKARNTDFPPVSVVITASNQYNDLKENLEHFLTQDYPNYEVLVVVDNSDDGSDELIADLSIQFPNLNFVALRQNLNWFSGRKFPLSLGIKSAQNNLILLSDPKCKPESNKWIEQMILAYLPGKELVVGYSSYDTKSGINRWLRFTAFYDALFYMSMAIGGLPYKGIGKNLFYSRDLFYQNKGFSSHYVISEGDDELFVNKTARKSNTSVQINELGKVVQVKKTSFSKWLSSEKSRLRIRRFFKLRDKILIRGFSFTSFAFYALLIALLILQAPWIVTLSIFALRFVSQIVLFGFAQKRLSEKKLLLLSPIFEIFLILIDFFIWVSLFFKRKRKWA